MGDEKASKSEIDSDKGNKLWLPQGKGWGSRRESRMGETAGVHYVTEMKVSDRGHRQ